MLQKAVCTQGEEAAAMFYAPYNLIPQGAGDYATTHRCPGEPATVAIMQTAMRLLVSAMTYDVPEQDLSNDRGHMPAQPKSKFVMSNVRAV